MKNKKSKFLIYLLRFMLLGFTLFTFAEKATAQIYKADTAQVNAYYEQAKKLIETEKYNQAEVLFVKIFKMDALLPDEICYHYGKTLFEQRKYLQSKTYLEKYIRLKGEQGEFYLKSLQLELDIEKATDPNASKECEKIINDTCHLCHGTGSALQSCTRCESHGRIICNLCQGNKVNIESTSFGDRYFTCGRCSGAGVITCPVCDGTKKEKRKCAHCKGKRFAFYRRKC